MNPVLRKVVIETNGDHFHLATISVNVTRGDLYYLFANKITVGKGDLMPRGTTPDHISFHIDGKRHAKDVRKRKYPTTNQLPTIDIGHQVLIIDEIGNVLDLPRVTEIDPEDYVLKLPAEAGTGATVEVAIVSGRLIAKKKVATTSVGQDGLLDVQHRSLGQESSNGDKIIQISLLRSPSAPPDTNFRYVTIPRSSNVSRPRLKGQM